MLAQPDPQKKSAFKNPFLYSQAVLAIVAIAVVWILATRWLENRNFEKRAREERTQKQQEQDRITLEQIVGKELAIQNFYTSPGTIRRDKTVHLSYALANAQNVT